MARMPVLLSSEPGARSVAATSPAAEVSLEHFACPNPECCDFNRFGAGNLSVPERNGKGKAIRRLYCSGCKTRFSERKGSLLEQAKISPEVVVRIIKCLEHGCSVEATADICEVDPRTVQRYVGLAGQRAQDFHQLQLDRLEKPPEAVELDELHARVSRPPLQKKGRRRNRRA